MKPNRLGAIALFSALAISCSKDDDPKNQDPNVNHVGAQWNITSSTYNIIDQQLSPLKQTLKNGTSSNVGEFYFDTAKGSFEFEIEGIHKEDVFAFTENGAEISIVNVTQSVGGSSVSQYTIVLDGEKTSATTMTLSGVISRQTNSGQFVMNASFELTKN
jgi:hypothetical protein